MASLDSVSSVYRRLLMQKHRRKHLRDLIDGSIPVFVAAAIARAVSAIIDAIIGDGGSIKEEIGVTFGYALLIAHTLGFVYGHIYSNSDTLFHYYFHLLTENAGFAWKQTISLIILLCVNVGDSSFAFGVWLAVVLGIILFISTSNIFQHNVLNSAHHSREHLQCFLSESFALPVAYSFTIIIASLFSANYTTSYLASVDDLNPAGEDATNKRINDFFLLYALGMTFSLAALQYYLEKCCSALESFSFFTKSDVGRMTTTIGVDYHDYDDRQSSCSAWLNPINSTVEALVHFCKTSCGYLVGCAWYTWSILVFQHYFSHLPYGGLLGLFVFASAITLLVATVLARQGVDDELLAAEGTAARQETNSRIRGGMDTDGGAVAAAADDIPRRTTGLSMGLRGESLMQIEKQESLLAQQEEDVSIRGRRKELLKTAARLVVGWSWEEFTVTCFTAGISRSPSISNRWAIAAVKTVAAIVIVVAGAVADFYTKKWRRRFDESELTEMRDTMDFSSPSMYNDGFVIPLRSPNDRVASLDAPLL